MWEKWRKIMGKIEENPREIIGKSWDNQEKYQKNRGKTWETHWNIHCLNEGFMGCIAGL